MGKASVVLVTCPYLFGFGSPTVYKNESEILGVFKALILFERIGQ